MSRFLRRVLWWSGGASLLIFLFPNLIVFASLALIVPGLVLALMPTVFLYTALFSAIWFRLPGVSRPVAAVAGALAVAALAFLVPEAINGRTASWLDEAAWRDREPPAPLHPAATVALEASAAHGSPGGCNDLCQLLLYNGSADRILALAPPLGDGGNRHGGPPRPTLFRLVPDETCAHAAAILGREHLGHWTSRAIEIAKAARLRAAAGDCPLAEPAGPDGRPDLTIRRLKETVGTRPGRLALAPEAVEVDAVELVVAGEVVARGSVRRAALLSTPLHLEPYGSGMSLDGWTWSRQTRVDGGREGSLDVLAQLKRWTTFDLEIPRGADPARLGERLDAALADPTLPPGHAAFRLAPDYYDALRGKPSVAADRERLARMLGDDRVTSFWFFPYEALRAPDAAAIFRDPLLDRLGRLARTGPEDSYKAVEQLSRGLPEGSFRTPDARVDALLADPDTRRRSPDLIHRLSDQGASVAGRLTGFMREGWTKPPPEARKRPSSGGESAVAALGALCHIAPDAPGALRDLRALEADGLVPPGMLESDAWRVTLLRLGADIQEFDKPANRGGTVDQYRERLARQRCEA